LFGGIRPEEVLRMTWDNINLKTSEITIPASISKTKKARLFKMSDCLYAWLNANQNNKPLIPTGVNIQNKRTAVVEPLKFDWIQDGLRHSFSTFHYAKYHNLEELRHVMGNSPEVIEKFYKGVIPSAEVEKFWSLTPNVCE
jgi:integrase